MGNTNTGLNTMLNARLFAPLFRTNDGAVIQFFCAKKNGEIVKVFPVDHSKFPSATAFLSKKGNELDVNWDFLISASVEDVSTWFPEFWNQQQERKATI